MQSTRIGIIGAGQLGRMMALAGYPLGVECRFVDRDADSPGGQVASIRTAALDDLAALTALAEEVDVLTFDIENVSVDALRELEAVAPVRPSPDAVAVAQDRLAEKRLFQRLNIPTTSFVTIDEEADFDTAATTLPSPIVLKSRRMGYDGRGQRIVRDAASLAAAWDEMGRPAAIAEGWVDFERELSLIGVRGDAGERVFYPLTENKHRDGILISSLAPYEHAELQRAAEDWMTAIMAQYDYRGVLAIEFFETEAGLLANEMAPRVHNSGHWTIEGAEISQFENHLRGVLGWPLGSTEVRAPCAMLNLLGSMPDTRAVLAESGVHLHDYGKQARPNRKLGHCTLVDSDRPRLLKRLASLERVVGRARP